MCFFLVSLSSRESRQESEGLCWGKRDSEGELKVEVSSVINVSVRPRGNNFFAKISEDGPVNRKHYPPDKSGD